jgi:hypothetical protein
MLNDLLRNVAIMCDLNSDTKCWFWANFGRSFGRSKDRAKGRGIGRGPEQGKRAQQPTQVSGFRAIRDKIAILATNRLVQIPEFQRNNKH